MLHLAYPQISHKVRLTPFLHPLLRYKQIGLTPEAELYSFVTHADGSPYATEQDFSLAEEDEASEQHLNFPDKFIICIKQKDIVCLSKTTFEWCSPWTLVVFCSHNF